MRAHFPHIRPSPKVARAARRWRLKPRLDGLALLRTLRHKTCLRKFQRSTLDDTTRRVSGSGQSAKADFVAAGRSGATLVASLAQRLPHIVRIRRCGFAFLLLMLFAIMLSGCGLPGTIAGGGSLPATKAVPTATPLPPVRFPQDEAPHTDLTEWWYYTGHFHSASGHEYGFELTFFQTLRGSLPPYYAAHYAISDISRGQFHYDQQVGFGSPSSIPPAGSTQGFHLTLNGWTATGLNGHDQLHADMSGYTIDLKLTDALPHPILHNGNGLITYGEAGYSYYYSRPLLMVSGTVNDHGTPVAVTGQAWMDHQWGNFLTLAGSGWDWYSIQLANHTEYMLYIIRDSQKRPLGAVGTYVSPDGAAHEIPQQNMRFEVLGHWTSPATSGVYPSGWRVTISEPAVSLTLTPALVDQELVTVQSTGVAYWEGAVRITGRANGAAVTGQGYVELTGYASLPPSAAQPGATAP